MPPPIGGVTIHVKRLCDALYRSNINYIFKELDTSSLILLPLLCLRFNVIHLHSSNPFVRFYFALICYVFRVNSITTIHGNLGRYRENYKNRMDLCCIKLSSLPIVLNDFSYNMAQRVNGKTKLLSAFIPPQQVENLDDDLISNIKALISSCDFVFSTNAYNMSFDKNNNEIYGVLELIDSFSQNLHYGLVISDPSGAYASYFARNNISLSKNIILIDYEHSYFEVLKLVDYSIRNTTTDGDPLSVKESLYLNKVVLATDVINRPKGSLIYKLNDFSSFLASFKAPTLAAGCGVKDVSKELITIYKDFLSSDNRPS